MAEIVGVLLAAGYSSRFGSNKLLAEIDGKPMIARSAAALVPCDRVVVVVQEKHEAIENTLQGSDVEFLVNPEPERGMGYTIACAVKATKEADGWCILPADMPYVGSSVTGQVVEMLRGGAALVAPFCNGKRGHPVGFSRIFKDDLVLLDGDMGARDIVGRNEHMVKKIVLDDQSVLFDIDTPDDHKTIDT